MMDFTKMMEGHLAKPPKRWLKSHEVKKMLQISYSTLQMLRNTGKMPYTRIGGLIYYDAAEIERILETEKKVAWKTLNEVPRGGFLRVLPTSFFGFP